MHTFVLVASCFLAMLATLASTAADETLDGPTVTATIQGETFSEVLDRVCREYDILCTTDSDLADFRGRPHFYVTPTNAADAFQQIATAYGACVILPPREPSQRVHVYVLPCDQAERFRNPPPSPRVSLGVVTRNPSKPADGDVGGAEIVEIDGDGPAFKAGLRPRDVVLSYNGEPIYSAADLKILVANTTQPGEVVFVTALRGTKRIGFNVQF